MNQIYSVIWNAAFGLYQAVAETGKAQGKGNSGKAGRSVRKAARAALALGTVGITATVALAQSLPTGGAVVAGSGTIAQSGQVMTVTQASARLATDWQSFNIGAGNTVNFVQPSASAVALNRVLGSDVSVIQGALNANGQVFLVNPNGVVFTPTAQVNVGSLVASSLALTTSDFMAGNYSFGSSVAATGGGSAVINQGNITVTGTPDGKGGTIALIAAKITNTGTLTANAGHVLLGAGSQVTLDLGGPVKLQVTQGAIDTLIQNGGAIQADGGLVYLTARAAGDLATSVINNTGTIEARSLGANAQGAIVLSSGHAVIQTGTLDASGLNGAAGGHIAIHTTNLIDAGKTDVSGQAAGGQIDVNASGRVLQTTAAKIQADSGAGQGGTVRISAGESAWLSGSLSATGQSGGDVSLTAPQLTLAEAQIDASGQAAGGRIRVGGGWQGGDADLVNALQTRVVSAQLDVSAKKQGNAGTAVVWSDNATLFGGNIAARGGASGGNGGQVEVSSHDQLTFGGLVDASAAAGQGGQNGRLLLDPKNIDIVASVSGLSVLNLPDPTPVAGKQFGSGSVVELMNGATAMNRIVVAAPNDGFTASNAGAVYLYNSQTGALISTLTGSQADDQVGSNAKRNGITTLSNGNYVVVSYNWANGGVGGAGAATWGNGSAGISGVVSSSNSLVGSQTNDHVGIYGVTALSNGNYVVASSSWANADASAAGAVTWGNGTGGISGAVSSSNSLVGTHTNDYAGIDGITALSNGNYVVDSSLWANGSATNAGAVTWGNGSGGTIGVLSSSNSLVGSRTDDLVGGYGVTVLNNGNYVVASSNWANGSAINAGAVTWGNGSGGTIGTVSSSNSLVGSQADDTVGSYSVTALSNGNYVVNSNVWANGSAANAGAVTWGNGNAGTSGAVTTLNSLVGSSTGDLVGHGDVTALNNGNYVVASYNWANGSAANAGAVTWGNGDGGTIGAVTSLNSMVGSQTNDAVGGNGGHNAVTALSNGNYVVASSLWANGSAVRSGAVTWGNGIGGTIGTVSSSNSLVGSQANDKVGGNGVTALSNGNYVVDSNNWANGSAARAGAATWGNGSGGTIGVVSSSNSLIGSQELDLVGSGGVTALSNGNYVVNSYRWANGSVRNAGAVTWGSGISGISGAVSSSNSLVGSQTGDYVGNYGVTALSNGNYVVDSSNWANGSATNAGAVTWGNGSSGTSGVITSLNSLIGSQANDYVGNNHVTALSNGNYVMGSIQWANGTAISVGAVSLGNGSGGTIGVINSLNSLIGTQANDYVGSGGVIALSYGRALVQSPNWKNNNGRVDILSNGAATLPQNFSTTPAASSSLVGSTLLDQLNAGTNVTLQANNDITLSSALAVNNPSGNGGSLTLQAGRSILLNANLSTDNGNLTLIANETAANGVANAYRDAGAAQITQAAGTTLDAGTGSVSIALKDGAGLTNNTVGTVTLASIYAGSLTVASNGFSASATADNKIYDGNTNATLSAASMSGLTLQSGSNLSVVNPSTGSFEDPNVGTGKGVTSQAFGITGYNASRVSDLLQSGTALTANASADISQRPITVTADDKAKVYGTADPTLTYQVTTGSLVAGDSLGGALSRSAGENVGNYTIDANALANGNYLITASNGTLAISQASVTPPIDIPGTPGTPGTPATPATPGTAGVPATPGIGEPLAVNNAIQAAQHQVSNGTSTGVAGANSFVLLPTGAVTTNAEQPGGLEFVPLPAGAAADASERKNIWGFKRVFVVNGGINLTRSSASPSP